MSPWYPFSHWGGSSRLDVSAVSLFPLGGGHRVLIFTRYPFLVLGGGHCVPMSPWRSFPRWGEEIVARSPCGIHFSVGGRVSCLDVSTVTPFPFGVGGSCPDVLAVSVFPLGGGIVPRCPRGIPFVSGRRKRISMVHRYLFFRWEWALCSETPAVSLLPLGRGGIVPNVPVVSIFPSGGVITSPCLRGIPLSLGRGASCPDFYTVFLFSVVGGTSCPDVSAVFLFPLGGGHRV